MSIKSNQKSASIVEELDGMQPVVANKVEAYFGDQPDVLNAIIRARKERKLSYGQIARTLSKHIPKDEVIKDSAVKNWLEKKGVS